MSEVPNPQSPIPETKRGPEYWMVVPEKLTLLEYLTQVAASFLNL